MAKGIEDMGKHDAFEALKRAARERGARSVRTFASITARPFFERMGYVTLRENAVVRSGVQLTNFLMEKGLRPER